MSTRNMSRTHKLTVAFDIETAPSRRFDEWPENIRDYLDRRIARARATDPTMDYGKLAATHPAFGRIVCISAARTDVDADGHDVVVARSFSGDEAALLEEFQDVFARFEPLYVTYNGLAFDVPYVLARMRFLGIACRLGGFTDTRRFRDAPHFDLMEVLANWDRSRAISLDVAAYLAGVPSPKAALDGSMVGEAFAQGRIEEICRYCERDVAATLNVYRRLILREAIVPPTRCFWKSPVGTLSPIDFSEPPDDTSTGQIGPTSEPATDKAAA